MGSAGSHGSSGAAAASRAGLGAGAVPRPAADWSVQWPAMGLAGLVGITQRF